MTGSARLPKTLSDTSSFLSPRPESPMPANICMAMVTSRYVIRMEITQSSAARPGPWSESLDSSFTVRAVSQPQKPKIDPDSPTMNADSVRPAGENQAQLKSVPTPAVSCVAIAMNARQVITLIGLFSHNALTVSELITAPMNW